MKSYIFWDITLRIPSKGDIFLRNVGWIQTDCTALYPGGGTFYNHENLKS
jgi:hypothetical protein